LFDLTIDLTDLRKKREQYCVFIKQYHVMTINLKNCFFLPGVKDRGPQASVTCTVHLCQFRGINYTKIGGIPGCIYSIRTLY
jgi:hypothetical protein